MRVFIFLLLSICSSVNAEPVNREPVKLPIDVFFYDYSASIRNDTVTVLVRGDDIWLYRIADDHVLTEDLLPSPQRTWGHRPIMKTEPDVEILYGTRDQEFYSLYRWSDESDYMAIETKIPIGPLTDDLDYITTKDLKLMVSEHRSTHLTFRVEESNAVYTNYYYSEINGDTASELWPLQTGRKSNNRLQTTVVGDTVYAMWSQDEDHAFWIFLTDRTRSLVFSRYDGSSWSDPIRVLEDYVGIAWVLGVYIIGDKLYCLWSHRNDDDNTFTMYYRSTSDRVNWSDPVVLSKQGLEPILDRTSGPWVAGNIGGGNLHLLANTFPGGAMDRQKGYYIFDGKDLEYQYQIDDDHKRDYSLVFDQGQPCLFFLKYFDLLERDDARIEKRITEDGDTVDVLLQEPLDYDGSNPQFELYFMRL